MVYFSPLILWNRILQTCLPGRVPCSSEEFSPSCLSPGVRVAAAAIGAGLLVEMVRAGARNPV